MDDIQKHLKDIARTENSNHPLTKSIDNKELWFCPIAFTQIFSEIDGRYAACCMAKPSPHTIYDTSIADYVNSNYFNNIRNEMLDPNSDLEHCKKTCSRCFHDEEKYGRSRRTDGIARYQGDVYVWREMLKAIELYKLTGEYEIDFKIFEIQLKLFGSQCNLDCYMCHTELSSVREKMQRNIISTDRIFGPIDEERLRSGKKYKVDVVIDELMEILPYVKYIKIIGGEPLLMKNQYELLDKIIESGYSKGICIKYQTNMTVLRDGKHNFLKYIEHFEKVTFAVSADGIGKYNDYIRRRSEWDVIKHNVDLVQEFDNVNVNRTSTISFLSILRYYEFLEDHPNDIGWDQTVHTVLMNPHNLQARNLPKEIKEMLIPKYEKAPDLQNLLRQEQMPNFDFEGLIKYLNDKDEYYGTDILELYPELKPYWR
jgi:sulfatase maturation enzyme AslB (radical SAM superfamily)